MSDAELLAKAVMFVAGPMPTVNGWIIDDDDLDGKPPIIMINRFGGRWWIRDGPMVLGVSDGATADWYCWPCSFAFSFTTPSEAFEFVGEWKAGERERAARLGFMKRWKDRWEPAAGDKCSTSKTVEF